jgi:tyrosine-protein kinase Etk/Wzc
MSNTINSKQNEIIDLKYITRLFTNNWKLYLIIIFLSIAIAYTLTKISPSIYEINTSIVINEKNNNLSDAPAQLMKEIGFISNDKNFTNELFVLKSSPLIRSALENLNFRISYFLDSKFKTLELYKSSPFVTILNLDHPQPVNCKIEVQILDVSTYHVSIEQENVQVYSFISNQVLEQLPEIELNAKASFNKWIRTDFLNFKIILNNTNNIDELKENTYSFIINTDKDLIKTYQSEIKVMPADIEATVANITMKSTVPEKDIDFLNNLTKAYEKNELDSKRYISEKTIDYINNQLNKVSESLDIAEDDLQRFRSNKQVLDISIQAQKILDELNILKNEKAKLAVNLKYVDYIQEYFNKNTQYSDLITPAAMGIDDPTLNNLIEELIRLNAEKASFIENNQEKSPYLQKINIRIDNLRNMISENINYIKKTTTIALEDADSRINQLNSEIRKMPETERELIGIERIFNINNTIYTYLLEKKSEAEIAKASYQSNFEIIEPADIVGFGPVSPNKSINLILGFFLGVTLPTLYIFIRNSVKTTYSSKEEIQGISNLPIIGYIYHNDKKTDDIVDGFPESHITESFRMLRINLNYFINDNTDSKILTITSTISGEGKSFIAFNFAQTLANNNLKTILVGFDLRKPKKYTTLNTLNNIGITDFLSNQANIEDIIQRTRKENLDVLLSGNAPPNPAEIIASSKTDEMIKYLKENYQYIIIDTPPIGVVTDGFLLMEKSNLNIFVTRIDHTPKREFESLIESLLEKKLNSSLIINDVKIKKKTKEGYGYYIND